MPAGLPLQLSALVNDSYGNFMIVTIIPYFYNNGIYAIAIALMQNRT
jgi:hypothetical protein